MIRLIVNRYMDAHGITRYELAKRTGILFPVIDKYYKNQIVRYDCYTLDKICRALGCGLSDVLEYIPDEPGIKAERSRSASVTETEKK